MNEWAWNNAKEDIQKRIKIKNKDKYHEEEDIHIQINNSEIMNRIEERERERSFRIQAFHMKRYLSSR